MRRVPEQPVAQVALGQAVRKLREERGVSQEVFATQVGVHRTYMGSVERGERNVTLLNVLRIAAALDITAADLLSRADL
jgi:transcriptional regulator with XRE-family HTH domain